MAKRPRPTPLPRPTPPQQHQIDANQLFAQIGQKVVENQVLQGVIAEKDARIAELEAELAALGEDDAEPAESTPQKEASEA